MEWVKRQGGMVQGEVDRQGGAVQAAALYATTIVDVISKIPSAL